MEYLFFAINIIMRKGPSDHAGDRLDMVMFGHNLHLWVSKKIGKSPARWFQLAYHNLDKAYEQLLDKKLSISMKDLNRKMTKLGKETIKHDIDTVYVNEDVIPIERLVDEPEDPEDRCWPRKNDYWLNDEGFFLRNSVNDYYQDNFNKNPFKDSYIVLLSTDAAYAVHTKKPIQIWGQHLSKPQHKIILELISNVFSEWKVTGTFGKYISIFTLDWRNAKSTKPKAAKPKAAKPKAAKPKAAKPKRK